MSRKLKQFIEENRHAFDDELPRATMWQDIEKSLQKEKTPKRFTIGDMYKWTAAAAVFFIGVTCFYFLVIQKSKKEESIVRQENIVPASGGELSKLAPEFVAEAKQVFQSIEKRQKELKQIAKEQPALYAQFAEDLSALDSSYRVLRQKAVQTPNREVILRAMMQNLQLQAELLARQLEVLNDIKPSKQQKDEENHYPGT
jgi:uncharacterized membrane-anchored protein YhcB (DUF1043 family)